MTMGGKGNTHAVGRAAEPNLLLHWARLVPRHVGRQVLRDADLGADRKRRFRLACWLCQRVR
jgi:hypothetical protein